MTVTSVKRIGDGQGGNVNGPQESSITLMYRVITDNPLDTPAEVRAGMPYKWGDALGDTGLICQGEDYDWKSKGPSQSVWEVGLEFSSVKIDQEEQERAEIPNPLDRRTRCSVSAVRYGELTNVDRDGDIKRNSAKDIYEEKEKDATRYVVNLSKNFQTIPDWIWDLQDKINDASVTIRGRVCEPGTLKFSLDRVPEIAIENNHRHFPISWTLDYRREGWKDRRVDAGLHYMKDDPDNPGQRKHSRIMVQVVDIDENDVETITMEPAVEPQWLDGSGGVLRDTNPDPQPGDETINEFDDYEEGDFSEMPLSQVASASAEV